MSEEDVVLVFLKSFELVQENCAKKNPEFKIMIIIIIRILTSHPFF